MNRDFLTGDLFQTVDHLLTKVPIGTQVSAGIRFSPGFIEPPAAGEIIHEWQVDTNAKAKIDRMVMEDEKEWEKKLVRREISRHSMGSSASKKSKGSKRRKASSKRSKASSKSSSCSSYIEAVTADLRTMGSNSVDSMYTLRKSAINGKHSYVDSDPLIDSRSEDDISSLGVRTSFLFPECHHMSTTERSPSSFSVTSAASTGPLLSAKSAENNRKIRESLNKLAQMLEEKKRRRQQHKARKALEARRAPGHRAYATIDPRPFVGELDQSVNISTDQFNFSASNLQLPSDASSSLPDVSAGPARSLRF